MRGRRNPRASQFDPTKQPDAFGTLGHKIVLAHNPFLDFLISRAWSKRLMLARLTRAAMPSVLVWTTHLARTSVYRLRFVSRNPVCEGLVARQSHKLRGCCLSAICLLDCSLKVVASDILQKGGEAKSFT
jgi:hypothetical protein